MSDVELLERQRDFLKDAIVRHRQRMLAGDELAEANLELWHAVGDMVRGEFL